MAGRTRERLERLCFVFSKSRPLGELKDSLTDKCPKSTPIQGKKMISPRLRRVEGERESEGEAVRAKGAARSWERDLHVLSGKGPGRWRDHRERPRGAGSRGVTRPKRLTGSWRPSREQKQQRAARAEVPNGTCTEQWLRTRQAPPVQVLALLELSDP